MKKLQLFLLAMAISAGSVLNATTPPVEEPFTAEVYELLEDLPIEIEEDLMVNLVITFNDQNKIIVLSVDCEDPYVKSIFQKRLNYKKVNSVLDPSIQEYKLPVRIKA